MSSRTMAPKFQKRHLQSHLVGFRTGCFGDLLIQMAQLARQLIAVMTRSPSYGVSAAACKSKNLYAILRYL